MDDSMNPDNLKREPRWEEGASIVSSEPSVTWGTDGNPTPVATETSQMAAGQSRAADTASLPEGLLESSFTTTTNGISTTPTSTSILSAVSETATPLITISTFSTTSTETPMTLSGTVSTTSASTLQTAAPGAYSGGGGSVKTKLAIALPIAIVGLIILALLFFFIRRRKRRNARQPYEMSGTNTPGVSTAALMNTTRKISIASPEPAAMNLSRLPVIDVTRSHDHEPTPGSASARSEDDPRTELGIAMAVPVDQRLSATEHDLRDFSRPVSSVSRRVSNGPSSAGLVSVRMPFESRSEDNDGVSIISGEHGRTDHERDFDDMSSVSSFDDEHERERIEGQSQSFR
ncbi:uncharacterized protein N7496_012090 [Penicillium cataractarum]|uniref:Mid2 domain-containing protein n=1 Tax=Penicillium cataractarum TaxID=2100454 RepID=A0A9W9RG56_9EURO|nr:uncharacterized protein N7496_012090 [Penicillium cataractarum]KAJ5359677.1 hypothetical protein N7496_012090 [Penicillium cataractarum]